MIGHNYPLDIQTLHIELTDKCQAACPMCARNFQGGEVRPFIKNVEISLTEFKQWFPEKFLKQLKNFYSCGNYGDPVMASDCLEIFKYVADINPDSRLAIHTNGSLKKASWWTELASVMHQKGQVIFAIDGFKGKHELYRRNTSFDKIIENMKAFIDAGGDARVDSLVFEHNQDDVEDFNVFLKSLGVTEVNFKSTSRFYNMKNFEVLDKQGSTEYFLYPANNLKFKKEVKVSFEHFLIKKNMQKFVNEAKITPACIEQKGIFVDPHGNVTPCCYVGSDYLEQPIKEKIVLQTLRNITVERSKKMMLDIGVPNLKEKNMSEILTEGLWSNIQSHWQGEDKCLTCIKNCSNSIYD